MVKALCREWGVDAEPRAATSEGGPNVDLIAYVEQAESNLATPRRSVYDRHPVISENIYGPIIRGSSGLGHRIDWLRRRRRGLQRKAFVVWCLPPLATVIDNVDQSDVQMAGVDKHITGIYAGYVNAVASWPELDNFSGTQLCAVYDYTKGPTAYEDLLNTIKRNVG